MTKAVVGVDGCKAGWFAVWLESTDKWKTKVFPNFHSLWQAWGDASLILVDIPIGLPDASRIRRECDTVARGRIGPRRSSVFQPPSRAALEESPYENASEANRQEVDKGLSRQAYALIPKIQEVDRLLREDGAARERVREVHPEVCFWSFAGEQPMSSNKKRAAGRDERTAVLRGVDRRTTDAVIDEAGKRFLRRCVAMDDILDALVAAYTGEPGQSQLRSIPDVPEYDSRGLRMEMVYCPADHSRD